ncbi:MAG: succinylglutamate desuccinylase/aspartoacylase family protein [Hellea sp.]|nr:succinylglutamate desuccinylase/aspartoacylase family protein [Hellea sp.]
MTTKKKPASSGKEKKKASKPKAAKRADFHIGSDTIKAGTRKIIDLPISALPNRLQMNLPVHVFHGRRDGPTMFVSAAVHGDEIIGVEVIRRLAQRPALKQLKGTLLLVPVVNGYGFLNHSRYLPDRRDLNRCFPGSEKGSLASRLANVFLNQIVKVCDYGIDLHSAALHRDNLPQIRITKNDDAILELARVFNAPAILHSNLREGSLRKHAAELNVPVLLYEAGEALRFDEKAVRTGLSGILRVMQHIGMIRVDKIPKKRTDPTVFIKSTWLRAPTGGLLRLFKGLGETVEKGERIGVVSDLLGEMDIDVVSTRTGMIVGRTNLPIVNGGDALVHIARASLEESELSSAEALGDDEDSENLFYEDEII